MHACIFCSLLRYNINNWCFDRILHKILLSLLVYTLSVLLFLFNYFNALCELVNLTFSWINTHVHRTNLGATTLRNTQNNKENNEILKFCQKCLHFTVPEILVHNEFFLFSWSLIRSRKNHSLELKIWKTHFFD